MNTMPGPYMVGSYVGGLLITLLLTRLVRWLVRGQVKGKASALIAAGAVLAFALGLGSLTMGFVDAFVVYAPCVAVWLLVDLFRA